MSDPVANVLIVEDDPLIAALIMELAETFGQARWVATAEEALVELNGGQWDLLVADIELPGMSGLKLVEAVRSACPRMATLILSAHASFDYAVAAVRADADDYMTKPIDPAQLAVRLEELVELARSRRRASQQRVLAIGAHPDDVEIGCGGIILRHAASGDEVTLLTLTEGEQGGDPDARREESQAAAEILGARLLHADLEDTSIDEGATTIATISEAIESVAPDIVYTHTSHDVHQDHRNTHRATLVGARRVPAVYCYQAPSTTVEFHPTYFVEIDEFIDRKLDAVRVFESQTRIRGYLEADLLRATARYWSRYARCRYAEPLEVVRTTIAGHRPADAPGFNISTRELDHVR